MNTNDISMFRETVQYSGQNIWVKPVCDFFELDIKNQYTKIKNDPILGKLVGKNTQDSPKNGNLVGKNPPDLPKNGNLVGKNPPDLDENGNLWTKKSTDLGEIDSNGRILLSKKGFIRWIQIINCNTIPDSLRGKFINYQMMIFDFLFSNVVDETQLSVEYTRLKRLRSLYGKIGREIQRVDGIVKTYFDIKYVQLKLPFEESKKAGLSHR